MTNKQKVEQIINSATVTAQVVSIDPELAEEMLKRNVSNRPVSKPVVNSYADSMKKGLWALNAQSIVFDKDGKLTDGQHRLYAIIRSGVTIETMVAGSVDPEAFTTYDCGRSRTLGQLIGMKRQKNFNVISTLVKNYDAYKRGLRSYENKDNRIMIGSVSKLSNAEYVEIYNEREEFYNSYGEECVRLAHALKKPQIAASAATVVWMYLVEDLGYEYNFVKEFFVQLYSKQTAMNPSIEPLRCKLMDPEPVNSQKRNNYIYTMSYKMDLLTKFWNAYAMGKVYKKVQIMENERGLSLLSAAQVAAMKSNE